MVNPMKNIICSHRYDRDGILNHMRQRKGTARWGSHTHAHTVVYGEGGFASHQNRGNRCVRAHTDTCRHIAVYYGKGILSDHRGKENQMRHADTLIKTQTPSYVRKESSTTPNTGKKQGAWQKLIKWCFILYWFKYHNLWSNFMYPLVPFSKAYIKDFTHIINILAEFDTTSYYTMHPWCQWSLYQCTSSEGITVIEKMLTMHRLLSELPHNCYVFEHCKVVLENSYFDFNGNHYHQVSGTAMGKKLTPSCANLFMTKFERQYVCVYLLQSDLLERFNDDILIVQLSNL